jgi:hypothetical protein
VSCLLSMFCRCRLDASQDERARARFAADAAMPAAAARRRLVAESGHELRAIATWVRWPDAGGLGVTASGVKQQSRHLDRAGLTLLLWNETSTPPD